MEMLGTHFLCDACLKWSPDEEKATWEAYPTKWLCFPCKEVVTSPTLQWMRGIPFFRVGIQEDTRLNEDNL